MVYCEEYSWLSQQDALSDKHLNACVVLDKFLGLDAFINQLCHGRDCQWDGDGCFFYHRNETNTLGPDSEILIIELEIFKTNLSPEELYYYLNIAYQNYVEDGQYPETIKLFADGLEYFRKACNIKGVIHKEASGNHKKQSSI